MFRVAVYDESETTAPELTALLAGVARGEFHLIGVSRGDPAQYMRENRVEILFYALDERERQKIAQFADLVKKCPDSYFIAVSPCADFRFVRWAFRAGAYDYLVQPLQKHDLENALSRLAETYCRRYLTAALIHKFDALISHIFQGGGAESGICAAIISEIFAGANMDPLAKQIAVRNAKEKIYFDIVCRKPWLEKFTCAGTFSAPEAFQPMAESEILAEWTRDFAEVGLIVKKYQILDNQLIHPIGQYVVTHVDERLSLDDLSERLYLNKTYISHIFKKVSGVSLVNFQLEVKIDRAKILLRDGSRKISAIAEQVGYGNVNYFRKIFKDFTGMSPGEYRAGIGLKG
ncbi:MAG: DNA-binding response regulator [Gracilibacteraceae bacterium]|jgi:two-component system response regulator YesN|nr:DNA-binding response regulator [Gracilibacteraceae bacterium]